jgi:hypothetical protein
MNAPRALLAAALVAAPPAVPSHASAQPAPLDPPVSAYSHTGRARTDQQFWGEATWLNPLSGLNLDRTSAGR